MAVKIFLDTETSGLDVNKHQILTLAMVIYQDGLIVHRKEYKIKQQPWAEIDEKALKVNGIDLETHNEDALTEKQVTYRITGTLMKLGEYRPIVVGHNVSFDLNFIQALYKRVGYNYPFDYHFQDTMVLGNTLKDLGILDVKNMKLATLAQYFDFDTTFHRALEDTEMTAKVYYKMLDLLKVKNEKN